MSSAWNAELLAYHAKAIAERGHSAAAPTMSWLGLAAVLVSGGAMAMTLASYGGILFFASAYVPFWTTLFLAFTTVYKVKRTARLTMRQLRRNAKTVTEIHHHGRHHQQRQQY